MREQDCDTASYLGHDMCTVSAVLMPSLSCHPFIDTPYWGMTLHMWPATGHTIVIVV